MGENCPGDIEGVRGAVMKILLVSHAYVAPENLRKPELLVRYPDLEMGVVRPQQWQTAFKERVENQESRIEGGFKIFSVPIFFSGDGGKYFYHPLKLYKAVRKFDTDIIHLEEEPWTPVALQLAFISTILRVRLVIFTWENLDLKLSFWQRAIEKIVLNRAGLVIVGNSGAKERIQKRGYRGRIEVLPQFGVNTEHFKPLDVSGLKSRLNLSGFVVGFVGRFVEEKGIRTLLKALAKLPEDVKLLLVSSNPSLPRKFELQAKNLKVYDRIKIVSGVPHKNLPKHINLMDVFVLPSITTKTWKEQFGRVLIEAMACKVPVVGSSSGAISEVIGDAGLAFEEKNAEALAGKIESLRSNENLRQQLSERGYQRVLQNFTFEEIAEETARIYREL